MIMCLKVPDLLQIYLYLMQFKRKKKKVLNGLYFLEIQIR